jgi:hypothetical protein
MGMGMWWEDCEFRRKYVAYLSLVTRVRCPRLLSRIDYTPRICTSLQVWCEIFVSHSINPRTQIFHQPVIVDQSLGSELLTLWYNLPYISFLFFSFRHRTSSIRIIIHLSQIEVLIFPSFSLWVDLCWYNSWFLPFLSLFIVWLKFALFC